MRVVMVIRLLAPLRRSLSPQTSHDNMIKGDSAVSVSIRRAQSPLACPKTSLINRMIRKSNFQKIFRRYAKTICNPASNFRSNGRQETTERGLS